MRADEISRFQNLRVIEQTEEGATDALPFRVSRQRPWKQKAGSRKGSVIEPGCDFYIAVIADRYGITYKVGSGKLKERLEALNLYRRGSQGEMLWAKSLHWAFRSADAARAAEDYILKAAARFASDDHSEFLVGIEFRLLKDLFSEAVEHGSRRDAELAAERAPPENGAVDADPAGGDPASG